MKPLSLRKTRLRVNKFLMPSGRQDVAPHFFSEKQVKFLEVYTETMDLVQACEASGLKPPQIRKNPYLMHEVALVNRTYMYQHRAKQALPRHERLMDKFEKEFDEGGVDLKKTAMSTLARMSEAALRAAGEFSEKEQNTGISGVQVVINIGQSAQNSEERPVVDIQAEVRDVHADQSR